MSTKGPNAGKIMIAASCLSKWHKYVSGAVMTYYPNTVQKDYFDGTTEVPGNIRCEAFCLRDGARMKPCRSCKNLFGLNTEDLREWPYGNCAEAESLSNLLENEREVETRVDEYSAEKDNRQRAEDEVDGFLELCCKGFGLTGQVNFTTQNKSEMKSFAFIILINQRFSALTASVWIFCNHRDVYKHVYFPSPCNRHI